MTFSPTWSHSLDAGACGLALARERNLILSWDRNHWLYLLNHAGQRQGQIHFDGNLVAACCADDGSAFAAVGDKGEIRWLAPDFMVRWQKTLPHPILAAAMDPFGQYLAVSDNGGNIHLFNQLGQSTLRMQTPRPLHFLAFVAIAPVLIGCADYGLVTSFDMKGASRWRDGLVAHTGALTANGDGSQILVACFSDGLQSYDLEGHKQPRIAVDESCRLASLAFTGRFILTAGMTNQLSLLNSSGQVCASHETDQRITALALSALGDYALIALADGTLVRLGIKKSG